MNDGIHEVDHFLFKLITVSLDGRMLIEPPEKTHMKSLKRMKYHRCGLLRVLDVKFAGLLPFL